MKVNMRAIPFGICIEMCSLQSISKRYPIECILDIDGMGRLCGVEIVGVVSQLDAANRIVATKLQHGLCRYDDYDKVCDCLYLNVLSGRPLDQSIVAGYAVLNEDMELASIEVPLSAIAVQQTMLAVEK